MPKSGTSGSVRGAVSNDRPYRDSWYIDETYIKVAGQW